MLSIVAYIFYNTNNNQNKHNDQLQWNITISNPNLTSFSKILDVWLHEIKIHFAYKSCFD